MAWHQLTWRTDECLAEATMHFHDFYEQMVRYFEAAEDARYLFGGSVILLIGLADVGYRLVRVSRAYRGGLRLPRK